ncbi:CPBP family intramembrane glutamic endopeptidase [Maribellus sediminis]|uniref:CPBP family intramembrane glutamic endopeptidase n=1 Tax=Maribellus sediminis TaxID=2696285 RepID=UPI001431E156|nr:type II CAAX endopeptidase family protein [Maribellus sediminis]
MAFLAFRDMKPFPQLLFSAFVIVVSFLAFLVISFLVALPVFGLDSMLNLPSLADLNDPESIVILKFFQTVQAIGLFILPPLILGYLFLGNTFKYLYLNKSFGGTTFLLVLVLMFAMSPFVNFLGVWNSNMSLPEWMSGIEDWMRKTEEDAAQLTEAFLNVKTLPGLAFNIFMVAFLPAVGEELLFRGVIQKIFTRITKSTHWGIWISAILFSAMHVQFFGFVPRLLLGAMFGYLLVWSGSMWLPVLGHFLNNAIAVIAMFFISNETISRDVEEFGSTSGSYYAAIISLGMIVLLLYLVKKENRGQQLTIEAIEKEG